MQQVYGPYLLLYFHKFCLTSVALKILILVIYRIIYSRSSACITSSHQKIEKKI